MQFDDVEFKAPVGSPYHKEAVSRGPCDRGERESILRSGEAGFGGGFGLFAEGFEIGVAGGVDVFAEDIELFVGDVPVAGGSGKGAELVAAFVVVGADTEIGFEDAFDILPDARLLVIDHLIGRVG